MAVFRTKATIVKAYIVNKRGSNAEPSRKGSSLGGGGAVSAEAERSKKMLVVIGPSKRV